jgi:hypothetical protein
VLGDKPAARSRRSMDALGLCSTHAHTDPRFVCAAVQRRLGSSGEEKPAMHLCLLLAKEGRENAASC